MQLTRVRSAWLSGGILAFVGATLVAAGPAAPGAEGPGVVDVERVEESTVGAALPVIEPAAPAAEPVESEESEAVLETQVGSASYYANMLAGRRTASGVPYDPSAAVAAHQQLPFGTRLRVHNLANGRIVEVEVVDRGPFAKGRILDLSRSAAEELDFVREGHTRVRIEVLEYGGGRGG